MPAQYDFPEALDFLATAIDDFNYPFVVYDFQLAQEVKFNNMLGVEKFIGEQLHSTDIERVKDGLSNVLFWGYYRSPGRRRDRVAKFRGSVDSERLRHTVDVFAALRGAAIGELKRLKLAEFGYLSFLSKLRTFLDPVAFCVIDLKLRKIPAIAHRFKVYDPKKPTSIPATEANQESYAWWVSLCRKASQHVEIPGGGARPVDVERGFFQLVERDKIDLADFLIRELDLDI